MPSKEEKQKDVFEEAREIAEALSKCPHEEARKILSLVACSLGLRLVGYSE